MGVVIYQNEILSSAMKIGGVVVTWHPNLCKPDVEQLLSIASKVTLYPCKCCLQLSNVSFQKKIIIFLDVKVRYMILCM